MTQKVEIGVHASTGGAEIGIQKMDAAAEGAAESVNDIADASRKANVELDDMAKKAERIAKAVDDINRARQALSRHIGHDVSLPDTAQFLSNFENMRQGRVNGIGRAVRQSKGFEDWIGNYQRSFADPKDAEAHRRRIMNYGMQGTDYANRPALPPEPGEPSNPTPGNGGGASRAGSSALAFGKSILALAGIGSLIGMANKSADLYSGEAVDTDTLKRRMGDLGVSFDGLQAQTRAAGEGLGIAYTESAKLALEYAKASGQMKNASGVRTAEGFSRAFGLDPSTSVQFFATMQRLKSPGADDQGSRRLALMIGEAVSKGGYGGKADEVMQAISGLAEEMTRNTLAAPNIAAIAGYLTTLTKSGFPGLDPAGAAALLGTADATVRRGGGMGDASLNFSYAALSRASPGLGVIGAGELMQAGLFGTTRGVFGKTKDRWNSPIGEWNAANGVSSPGLNDTTNLSKELSLLHAQYSGKGKAYLLDAIKNQFGLNYAQGAALDLMNSKGPENLSESARLVGAAGLDFTKLSASGIGGIGRVAAAKTPAELRALYGDVMGRGDLNSADRSSLKSAMDKGDAEGIKEALVKVLGTHDQEADDGTKTRLSITSLQDAMTNVGKDIVNVLNPIRDFVSMMAERLAPDQWRQSQQNEKDKGVDFHQQALDSGMTQKQMKGRYTELDRQFDAMGGGYHTANMLAPKPTYRDAGNPRHYALAMDAYNHLHGLAAAQSVSISDDQHAAIMKAAGGDKGKAGFLESLLRVENRGQKAPRNATSGKGAQGFWQFLPSTWNDFGKDGDINNFADGATHAGRMYDWLNKRYKGNKAAMAAYYNGGAPQADAVMAGRMPSARETQDYLGFMAGLGNTQLPNGDPAGRADAAKAHVHVTVGGEVHLPVKDASGNVNGVAKLTPFVARQPAGATPTPTFTSNSAS